MSPDPDTPRPPVVAAWGMGVDSTAMIIELVARGEPPDLVLTADTGSERPETYAYQPLFQRWMDDHGVNHAICRYTPKRFKHWPPYFSLLENCLTNATLPSIAFSRHSCLLKWKVEPQDRYVAGWAPAQAAWARGERVSKLIGFDASPADSRRYAHAEGIFSPLYAYRYPLRDWGWDRAACAKRIRETGLPGPIKSSCFFCSAMKPQEVTTLPRWCLRLIVLLEARAAPRLRTVEGLWRRATAARPGTMTAFIRAGRARALPGDRGRGPDRRTAGAFRMARPFQRRRRAARRLISRPGRPAPVGSAFPPRPARGTSRRGRAAARSAR